MGTQAFPVVVLISGNGSNLQAIIDYIKDKQLNINICAVISNKDTAYGLERAKQAHIPTQVIRHTDYCDRDHFDAALQASIEQYQPKLVVLAGFMRILTDKFVRHFQSRLINIHPSLLPKYRGLDTHQRVLDAKETEHGVSIHLVTLELDSGPIIAQKKIAVTSRDTAKTLEQRIHIEEYQLYPAVIEQIAKGAIDLTKL